jgi:hypothetical protein
MSMTADPAPVMTTLEYARPGEGLGVDLSPIARPLLWLAVLSGPCVAVCFLAVTGQMLIWGVLHLGVYAATIAVAVVAGRRMARCAEVSSLASATRLVLDAAAGGGARGDRSGSAVRRDRRRRADWRADGGRGLPADGGDGLPARAAVRGPFGGQRSIRRQRLARSFTALGVVKFLYESVWLTCCGAPLILTDDFLGGNGADDLAVYLAMAAFFGCFGFAVVWLWMVVSHARFAVVTCAASDFLPRLLTREG